MSASTKPISPLFLFNASLNPSIIAKPLPPRVNSICLTSLNLFSASFTALIVLSLQLFKTTRISKSLISFFLFLILKYFPYFSNVPNSLNL